MSNSIFSPPLTRRRALAGLGACAAVPLVPLARPALAQTKLAALDIPSLAMPSLGAFPSPVIKEKGFDKANGLDVTFQPKAAGIYRSDFASGASPLGGSGSLLIDVGLVSEKGAKIIYLFNINDYWGTVAVPGASAIKTLKDLSGKKLAAALPTSNYAIFRYFAKLSGLDLSTVEVMNTSSTALVPMMVSGRVDGVQLWEPAYSILASKGDYRALDFIGLWRESNKVAAMPYQGIAAHEGWVKANPQLIPRLYAMYAQAADFIESSPDEAGSIIAKASKTDPQTMADLIRSKRLGFNMYWAGEQRAATEAMFRAALEIGFLKDMPAPDVLFDKPV
ncbi:ABC transporter substrate-binding protein [Aquabacter spiritensis]|uniref:ABC-type nitrate/sulfonate/bicarbonate transport system substrate-binding protein n=1 Tax=Aquabacter spiritensis TaxID=933073 RepID=A0A4R3M194_9HYPH|nr:ABC transporter substrate-binding protein [Aquabacter spiritensis]TCT06762.1 ABC-type nitrate/sulfonate/bicarbonate transport system substrate-binding protein [Aquabacter spiritensis]